MPKPGDRSLSQFIPRQCRHRRSDPACGNVIGGGDWAAEKAAADILGAIDSGTPLLIRSPGAVRPGQHVLEPLSGYLTLAERLHGDGKAFAEAWNFGPADEDAQTVGWILEQVALREPEVGLANRDNRTTTRGNTSQARQQQSPRSIAGARAGACKLHSATRWTGIGPGGTGVTCALEPLRRLTST